MRTTRTSRRLGLALVLWALAAGCADPVGGAPARVCTPGATQRCECAVGTSVQSCALDGTHWERCECTAQDAGGDGDAAAQDAQAPDGSAADAAPPDATAADAPVDAPRTDAADAAPPGDHADATTADVPGPDAPPADALADVALDAAPDVRTDVGVDATPDVPPDVGLDAAPDVRMDAAVDARPDVALDAPADAAPLDVADAGAGCSPAAAGAVSATVTTTAAFYSTPWPVVAQAGGAVLVFGPFDGWRRWYRWSGSDWASEAIPWPADVTNPTVTQVTPLVDRTVLVTFTHGGQRELGVYDGRAWTARVALPSTLPLAAATRTPDGVFRLLTRELGGFAMRDATPAGVGMPGPVPVPAVSDQEFAMTSLTTGRIVIAYVQTSLYAVHRLPGSDWSAPTNLTSAWAVRRTFPVIAAARAGGVLVGLTGVSTSYRFPHVFASPDGVRWNEGETLNRLLSDSMLSLDAECLDNPVALLDGGYRVGPRLWRKAAGAWSQIDGPPPWPNGSSSAVVRPGGRAFWAWDQNNEAVTSFSVTMRGGRE